MRQLSAGEIRDLVIRSIESVAGGPRKDLNHALAGRLADAISARLELAGCTVTRAGPARHPHGEEEEPVWLESSE